MRARVAHAYSCQKSVPIYANSTLKSQNRHWHKLGRIGLTTPQKSENLKNSKQISK